MAPDQGAGHSLGRSQAHGATSPGRRDRLSLSLLSRLNQPPRRPSAHVQRARLYFIVVDSEDVVNVRVPATTRSASVAPGICRYADGPGRECLRHQRLREAPSVWMPLSAEGYQNPIPHAAAG